MLATVNLMPPTREGDMFFGGIFFTFFRGIFFTSLSVSWNIVKILHGPPEGLPKKGIFFHLSHDSVSLAV